MASSPWLDSLRDALSFARRRLLVGIEALDAADLDVTPVDSLMSPRRQILHVVWAEAHWRGTAAGGERPGATPDEAPELDAAGLIGRLAAQRALTMAWFETLTDADLTRPVRDAVGNELSVVWVLQHLARHDAHHAGQILLLWRLRHPAESIGSGYRQVLDTLPRT